MMHHRTSPRPPVRASRLERWDKASGQQGDRCDHLPGNVESAMIKSRRLVVALLIVAGLFGCRSKKAETLPDELIGSWETSAPQYPNSFIEITDDSVIFGTEEGTGNAYTIDEVEVVRDTKHIVYTITYSSAEEERFVWAFYYDPSNGGEIRFKNQPQVVWTKRPGIQAGGADIVSEDAK